MACKQSVVDAAFAFAILSQLLAIAPLVLTVLHMTSLFPLASRIPYNLLAVSAPVLLIFGIICLAAPGHTCIDFIVDPPILGITIGIDNVPSFFARIGYSLQWGIVDLFLAQFFGILVDVCISKGYGFFWRTEPTDKAQAPPQTQTQPQLIYQAQSQLYVQTGQAVYPQPAPGSPGSHRPPRRRFTHLCRRRKPRHLPGTLRRPPKSRRLWSPCGQFLFHSPMVPQLNWL